MKRSMRGGRVAARTVPRWTRGWGRATLVLILGSLAACGDSTDGLPPTSEGPRPPAGRAWVIFDADTVVAEVADTPERQQQGLMGRDDVPPGTGMLFVFEDERTQVFYMRNTYVPLDIAFMDRAQVIVDIQQMEPLTENLHQSARPALLALEVPQGWFAAQGIQIGDIAQIVYGRR